MGLYFSLHPDMRVLLVTFFAFSAFYVVQACVSCTPPACNTAPCNITIGCGCYRKSNTNLIFFFSWIFYRAIGIRQSFWCDGNETCQMLFWPRRRWNPRWSQEWRIGLRNVDHGSLWTLQEWRGQLCNVERHWELPSIINMSRRDTFCEIWCNLQETLGHFINTNDVHVPNELDFDEMDLNKDGKVCIEEWKEMKAKEE